MVKTPSVTVAVGLLCALTGALIPCSAHAADPTQFARWSLSNARWYADYLTQESEELSTCPETLTDPRHLHTCAKIAAADAQALHNLEVWTRYARAHDGQLPQAEARKYERMVREFEGYKAALVGVLEREASLTAQESAHDVPRTTPLPL